MPRFPRTLARTFAPTLLTGWFLVSFSATPTAQAADGTPRKNPVVPPEVLYRPDLTYRTVGNKQLKLDLACPRQGKGPFPTVVLLHGTGLLTQGRKGSVPMALELARLGYGAVAVGYRHSPTEAFPAALQDAQEAVRLLHGHAADYHLDADRIAALGFSGGGSLACLLAMVGPQDGLTEKACRLRAVISYFAPSDFPRLHAAAGQRLRAPSLRDKLLGFYLQTALEGWLGGTPGQVAERYARASPITYARPGAPPTLLIHGTGDAVVPAEQSA
jgi:acetyl esterase/lipase